MEKRFIAIIMSALLAAVLCGCGDGDRDVSAVSGAEVSIEQSGEISGSASEEVSEDVPEQSREERGYTVEYIPYMGNFAVARKTVDGADRIALMKDGEMLTGFGYDGYSVVTSEELDNTFIILSAEGQKVAVFDYAGRDFSDRVCYRVESCDGNYAAFRYVDFFGKTEKRYGIVRGITYLEQHMFVFDELIEDFVYTDCEVCKPEFTSAGERRLLLKHIDGMTKVVRFDGSVVFEMPYKNVKPFFWMILTENDGKGRIFDYDGNQVDFPDFSEIAFVKNAYGILFGYYRAENGEKKVVISTEVKRNGILETDYDIGEANRAFGAAVKEAADRIIGAVASGDTDEMRKYVSDRIVDDYIAYRDNDDAGMFGYGQIMTYINEAEGNYRLSDSPVRTGNSEDFLFYSTNGGRRVFLPIYVETKADDGISVMRRSIGLELKNDENGGYKLSAVRSEIVSFGRVPGANK